MTKTRAKLSWEGGDVAPFPRSPVSLGAGKKNSKAASVPIETVSFEGCSRKIPVQFESRTSGLAASFSLCLAAKTIESTGLWRRRVEVESTIRPAKDRIAGFEGRGDHRTPFAPREKYSWISRLVTGDS